MVFYYWYCQDSSLTLSGPCFEIRDAKPEPIFFNDDDIEDFLMDAGLEDAQPERAPIDDDMTPKTRRRWVLGDVIHDAVGLLEKKYGAVDMDQDDAYRLMGLFPHAHGALSSKKTASKW